MSFDLFTESNVRKKQWLVLLLALSTIVAFALNITFDPAPKQKLTSQSQIDSLIVGVVNDLNMGNHRMRVQTVVHDSLFQRKNYRINVEPWFSKTSFHHQLHQSVYPFGIKIYGRVIFPEEDLHLHLLYNNTVQRSIVIRTDRDLSAPSVENDIQE